jgi:hypothetical protein
MEWVQHLALANSAVVIITLRAVALVVHLVTRSAVTAGLVVEQTLTHLLLHTQVAEVALAKHTVPIAQATVVQELLLSDIQWHKEKQWHTLQK